MSSMTRIKVMLADDHPIMRDGLRDALEGEGDFEVVGVAADGVEAVSMAQSVAPEVIVMDVMMPHKDGVDACREIMELLPDTRVLMLTASTTEDAVVEAIAAGATGYLQKDSGPEELAEAIREVAQGRLRIPDKSIRRVFALIRGQRGLTASRALKALTDREREILQMFASGKSYAQIAEVLRPDRRGQGHQGRDRQELDLPHSGQTGSRYETGDGGLGREGRPAGGRGAGWMTQPYCGRRRTVRRDRASPNGERFSFGPSVDARWSPNPTKVQEHWVSDTKMSKPPTYGTTRQCQRSR